MIKNYSNFINENENDHKFSTPIKSKNVEFLDYDGGVVPDEEYETGDDFVVNWYLDMDTRPTGINSFATIVSSITGTYFQADKEMNFDSSDYEITCQFGAEFSLNGDAIIPTLIEINVKAKKIIVTF